MRVDLYELITFSMTDPDSARYLLSALVQSEAAILALVVSLTIIAVQHAASTYSIRTIGLFKKSPIVWFAVIIYLIAMITQLFSLRLIIDDTNPPEPLFSISCALGIIAFIVLIPYYLKMLELLEPVTIIQIFSDKITYDDLKNNKYMSDKFDTVQPVVNIIVNSLNRSDVGTAIDALNGLIDRISFIINNYKEDETTKIDVVVQQLLFIDNLAINKDIKYINFKIINYIKTIGEETAKNGWTNGTEAAISNIEKVAVKNGDVVKGVIESAINAIHDVAVKAIENKLKDNTKTAISIIQNLVLNPRNISVGYTQIAICSIEDLGRKAIENELKDTAKTVIYALKKIGLKTVKDGRKVDTEVAIYAINEIGSKAVKNGWGNINEFAISAINEIRSKAVEKPGWEF